MKHLAKGEAWVEMQDMRFEARVIRYREDKTADDADTIDAVRSLGPPGAA